MATFKTIGADDIQTSTSVLSQLVDVIQEDISGSSSRKKYQVFVTGGVGPGVTSSLYQTVFDQDFTLQTSNAVLDMTVGLYVSGATVMDSSTGVDSNGKRLFPSSSLMMREKVENYKQFAQLLLGNANGTFYAPGVNGFDTAASSTGVSTGSAGDRIEEALFVNFKRLFARDEIRKETYAIRMYKSASLDGDFYDTSKGVCAGLTTLDQAYTGSNLTRPTTSGSAIYADVGASSTQLKFYGGDVGFIKNTADTSKTVGLMWYDYGVGVFDMGKVFCIDQHMSGVIKGMNATAYADAVAGQVLIGSGTAKVGIVPGTSMKGSNAAAQFIPDLMVSASIDGIIDHIASTRFGTGSFTATTFQNVTNINSTLLFCRATADEFNYSSNPTFRNANGELTVIEPGDDTGQRTFTFVTTVGMYNSNNELLGVAKLSRPVEKNDEKDLTVRVRLDF